MKHEIPQLRPGYVDELPTTKSHDEAEEGLPSLEPLDDSEKGPTGPERPVLGDKLTVCDESSGYYRKTGVVVRDDMDSQPFVIEFDDGTVNARP